MKAGKIVKITVSVIVLGGLAAAGNYFIGRDGSYYQTAKDGSQTYAYINEKNSFGHIVKHPAFSDFSDFYYSLEGSLEQSCNAVSDTSECL